jgi:hypothetical protein
MNEERQAPSRNEEREPPPEGGPPHERGSQPSEEELRERVEEQLRKVRVQDLLLETVVSVLNLSARRIAKEDERDLDQARVGIEAVRALMGLLDDEPAKQVRSALSEVQMLYARHAEGGPGEPEVRGEEPSGGAEGPRRGAAQRGPSRLWTPPGTG